MVRKVRVKQQLPAEPERGALITFFYRLDERMTNRDTLSRLSCTLVCSFRNPDSKHAPVSFCVFFTSLELLCLSFGTLSADLVL